MRYSDHLISTYDDKTLLSILLSGERANYVSKEAAALILQKCNNNLNTLLSKDIQSMMNLPGVHHRDAWRLKIAMELSNRRKISEILSQPKISSPKDVYELFRKLSDSKYEEFWILLLNKANCVIDRIKISEGGVSGTVVDLKKIFCFCFELLASGLILIHNHPSGNVTPSETDRLITKKIMDAGKMLDIVVLDHIIVGKNEYFSFADDGQI